MRRTGDGDKEEKRWRLRFKFKWIKKLGAHNGFWTGGAVLFHSQELASYMIKVEGGWGRCRRLVLFLKTNFSLHCLSSKHWKLSRMFVQCEMFIYVKCLCCDIKHPVRLRKIIVTKRWFISHRCNLKTTWRKKTFFSQSYEGIISSLVAQTVEKGIL